MSVICFPAFAQTAPGTSYEKALEQLVEIRDADIAKELALIEESYNRETRDLLRITMQIGNLETANKVKRMLENPDKKAAQYAETTNSTQEKAVVRLMEQREKQIAQATAPTVPIQKWFKESSERLVRKAVQAGDLAVANKLKAMIETAGGAAGSVEKNMVRVEGGALPSGSGLAGQVVATFQIGKYEVTWGEWKTVRDWAVANGFSFENNGSGTTNFHPVADVSWYDVVKWCNAKSQMEGLAPVYSYNGTVLRTGGWQILGSDATDNIVNDANKNGYRLPTISEWEWAARGGISTKGYTYSGGNDANLVAWYSANSGNATHAVGTKAPNELGIYDMSGNAMEWCWDRRGIGRCARGGTWNLSSESLANNQLGVWVPSVGNFWDNLGDFGFRLARSAGN